MSVTLIPIGMLKTYTAGQEKVLLDAGPTVEQLLEAIEIPTQLVAGVVCDEVLVSQDYRPQDGETVKLLTIMGGG